MPSASSLLLCPPRPRCARPCARGVLLLVAAAHAGVIAHGHAKRRVLRRSPEIIHVVDVDRA